MALPLPKTYRRAALALSAATALYAGPLAAQDQPLVIARHLEINSLDPHRAFCDTCQIYLSSTYQGLVSLGADNKSIEPALADEIESRPFTTLVVMHELAHGLGPRVVHGTDESISVRLGASYSPIEEAKADVVGVLALARLADEGVYTEEFKRQVYISSVASLFRCVRFGTSEAHGKGCAVQLNHLLEAGAMTVGEDGKPIFEESDVKELGGKNSAPILRIRDAVFELSGLHKTAVEEDAEDFSETLTGSSSTD